MFQEEGDDLEIDENDVSEEDLLMYSTFAGLRTFVLNDESKTNVFGVLIEEYDDSFLVGLPARIIRDGDDWVIDPFASVPYFRMMKSAIMGLSYMIQPYEDLYRKYLDTKGSELYPEISEYIEEGAEDSEPAESAVVGPTDTNVSLSKDADQGQQVLGMTDEELRQYLLEKYNNGELSDGSGKKH